jgi:hypothetical protein
MFSNFFPKNSVADPDPELYVLGLQDLDTLVRSTDTDTGPGPAPDPSIIKQK